MATVKRPQPIAGRRERRRVEVRRRLLEVGERVFLHKGVAGTTINEITEAADIGFGTFYSYFESKEQLATEVAEMVARREVEMLSTVRSADPAEAMASTLATIVRRDRASPQRTRFLIEAGTDSGVLEREYGLLIMRLVRDGVIAGRFDREYAEHAPWSVAALVLGTLFYGATAPDPAAFERGLVYHTLRMLGVSAEDCRELAGRAASDRM